MLSEAPRKDPRTGRYVETLELSLYRDLVGLLEAQGVTVGTASQIARREVRQHLQRLREGCVGEPLWRNPDRKANFVAGLITEAERCN